VEKQTLPSALCAQGVAVIDMERSWWAKAGHISGKLF
jgi:hypothetical protein